MPGNLACNIMTRTEYCSISMVTHSNLQKVMLVPRWAEKLSAGIQHTCPKILPLLQLPLSTMLDLTQTTTKFAENTTE